MISRILEQSGICTVGITNTPDLIRQTKAPRALAVKYPYGLPLGAPGNIETQRKIIIDAFNLLETDTEPRTIWELCYPLRKKWLADKSI